MTSIKIKFKQSHPDEFFNEDVTEGIYRIGRQLVISKPTSNSLSGVTNTTWESEKYEDLINTSGSYYKLSKIRQGTSIRSTFDIEADSLPYMYIQGGKSPYPQHIFQNFHSTFDEDFFGVEDVLDRSKYIPYEDITDLQPQYMSSSIYLNTLNPYSAKIYPKYSGSHYISPYSMNGVIEPFDITRHIRPEITSVDTRSNFSARGFIHGISADIMGGKGDFAGSGISDNPRKGTILITDLLLNENFHPSNQIDFFDETKIINIFGNSAIKVASPEAHRITKINYFDDTIDYLKDKNSYNQLDNKNSTSTFLSGSMRNISLIGTKFKSANAGMIYKSTTLGNTTLGTDSIAFGGLSRSN
jgi:hypothetical protein